MPTPREPEGYALRSFAPGRLEPAVTLHFRREDAERMAKDSRTWGNTTEIVPLFTEESV